jgi:alpha-glucuronidase
MTERNVPRASREGRARPCTLLAALAVLLAALMPRPAAAEDGYELWLRYQALPAAQAGMARAQLAQLVIDAGTPMRAAARDELLRGIEGLAGRRPDTAAWVSADGALVVGTPDSLPRLAALDLDLTALGQEGYLIRSLRIDGRAATAIVANTDAGLLYGAFGLLRMLQTGVSLDALHVQEAPQVRVRVLNHWDNLDGHVERGYAGASIWDWWKLPDYRDPRYTDYARANASLGINGTVLNNVNANATILTPRYLARVAALADVLRPYGIRVYLSARFSAPMEIGGLATADPLEPAVRAWWAAKAAQIYALVPDFGGFLVKANSEGQPGPQDYDRTHADGANMLADALAPHGGIVMWRAFVYSQHNPDDRAKQAFTEFKPLDGAFRDNVLVQVKNGPIDFQPREPFSPLFGAMPQTPLMMEFQITKEYLGFATHLAYLGPLFEEVLQADTHSAGAGSTVARVVSGAQHGHTLTGMAGVANIGTDRNWSGSVFDQANWYAFGRLAWNPVRDARSIAAEWARMTFSTDDAVVQPVVQMMMASREAVVDYMTPLGLHHLMGRGHHYGPMPWDAGGPRADWTPVYYHRADAAGIGFDRSSSGSNAVEQYAAPVRELFDSVAHIPERYLLWFHRVPWQHRMASGRTLWQELAHRYDRGVEAVADLRASWAGLAPHVDAQRHAQTATFLAIQQREAQWWRDASMAYWQSLNGLPWPDGFDPPAESLAHYQSLSFPEAPGN